MESPLTPALSPADGGEGAGQDHGCLPAWRRADLPEPLPFSTLNVLRTIGPGAILLGAAIGGGEWFIGPLMVVNYGPTILWIATVGIVIQVLFNMEAVRYTLYTGEPILTGVMRLWPGPRFWAPFYILLGTAQLAIPALAAGCATVLLAAFLGRLPAAADQPTVQAIGMGVILVAVVVLLSGKSIERLLEKVSWAMILFIFSFLTAVNVLFVPVSSWAVTMQGFLIPQPFPEDLDLALLGVFAATAGAGGLGNIVITNWFRDKGFAMGRYVGGIGGALAGHHQEIQSEGVTFPITDENLRRWKLWWSYAEIDQRWLWGLGCFLGMFLNVNLAQAIVPHGVEFKGVEAGAFQAKYMAQTIWSGLWGLTLINGFWILFSTHLGNSDVLTRTIADILWAASPRFRRWPISRTYALILLILTGFGLFAIHLGSVLQLFTVLGIVAMPIMAIAAVQILRINTRFLPPELRPALWRRAGLLACAAVYGGIAVALVLNTVRK